MNLLKSRCPNCHVRHFKAHSGCFGQDNCPFPDSTCEHLNATFEREGDSTRGSCPDCGDIAFSARWEEE